MAWGKSKETRSPTVVDQAAHAMTAGHTMFTPTLHTSASFPTVEWGPIVEAIEQTGWILIQWSVAFSPGSIQPMAFPVFRRR